MKRAVLVTVAWLALAGLLRVAILQPEHCAVPEAAVVRAAATATIDWFDRNQQPVGRFTYAYRRDTDTVLENRELVRHHGVLLSLYQAAHDGYPGALAVADRGEAWSEGLLVATGDGGQAIGRPGEPASTGAAALFVAALVERREATDDPVHDELIVALATFLLGQVDERGSVRAAWDAVEGPLPEYSLFFTGEAMWALARVATVDPSGPWLEAATRIGRYIATDRNQAEQRLPFFNDHWASYGFDELAGLGVELGADEIAFVRATAGTFDTSIRFESQNTGSGLVAATRGEPSLGAGVGTLGEGAGGLQRLAEQEDRLADLRTPLRHTVACVAHVLTERQVQPHEVEPGQDPELTVGAWFRDDRTQLDDQQHALSALLAAERMGAVRPTEAADRPSHTDHGGASGLATLLLTLFAASDPLRLRGRAERGSRARSALSFGGLGLAVVLLNTTVLDWLEVSEPTARVAAGVAVVLCAAVDLVDPKRLGPSVVRPGALLVLLVGSVDPGRGSALVALAASVVLGLAVGLFGGAGERPSWTRTVRWVAVLALFLGLDLVVDGVYAF